MTKRGGSPVRRAAISGRSTRPPDPSSAPSASSAVAFYRPLRPFVSAEDPPPAGVPPDKPDERSAPPRTLRRYCGDAPTCDDDQAAKAWCIGPYKIARVGLISDGAPIRHRAGETLTSLRRWGGSSARWQQPVGLSSSSSCRWVSTRRWAVCSSRERSRSWSERAPPTLSLLCRAVAIFSAVRSSRVLDHAEADTTRGIAESERP